MNGDEVQVRGEAIMGDEEQLIGTVDIWELHHYHWPIIEVFARRAMDEMELYYYLRQLLATRRWDRVRVVPHRDESGLSSHVFDVYGHPSPMRYVERVWH